jgi:hypothetical protein
VWSGVSGVFLEFYILSENSGVWSFWSFSGVLYFE